MNTKVIPVLFLSLLFTAIGLICGWYSAAHSQSNGAGGAADDAHSHSAAAPAAAALSPEALKNIGVVTTPAQLSSYRRYQPVPAIVATLPCVRQGVYAPMAGRIQGIEAGFGSVVQSGEVLLTLIRDPLPRAGFILTEDVLKPVSENMHESMAGFRRALVSVEILRKEQNRLQGFSADADGIPVLPQKEILQVQYDLLQAERELSIAQQELSRHGLNTQQISEVEKGKIPPIDVEVWLGALRQNGFWTPLAQEIYAALPRTLQGYSWTVATIGELVAGDLADAALVEWMRNDKRAGTFFLEIGGLMQRGHSLKDIKDLYALGALESVVEIRAPDLAPDWDLTELKIKPGQYVEEGEYLLTLGNPRCLYLRVEPSSGEVETIVEALQSGVEMEARALVPGAAPDLSGLTISRIFTEEGREGTLAQVPLDNKPLFLRESSGGTTFRSWQLREGQKYEIRVPVQTFDKIYLFPGDAVVDDGPDKVLYLQSGDGFQPVPVEVLYQDHEVAVIPATADIFPGNPIVTRGAFALSLALKSSSGGAQLDSGCGHSH